MGEGMKPNDINRLIALFEAGRYGEVEKQARSLLARHPDAGIPWDILGASLRMQGKGAQAALPALRKAAQFLPNEAGPHYNLGYALQELGQLEAAVASYRRALQLQPNFAEPHVNLGNALRDLGQLDEAVASYRRALQIAPDFAVAHNNLGSALKELGQIDAAAASYRRALDFDPAYVDVHINLGNVLRDLGRREAAVASYRRALELRPDFAEAHSTLGNALQELGQLDAALASQRRALELKPDFAQAHYNLGNVLQDLAQGEAAVASYRRALELDPGFALAHNNLGNALRELGQLDAAAASYRRALALRPAYADAHNNLGNALRDLGERDAAVASYRRALEIEPGLADAHYNLGIVLKDLGKFDAAVASGRRALEIEPGFADAHNSLGIALQDLGQLDEAVASHRRAVELKPDYAEAFGNLLFVLNYHPDKSAEDIFSVYREYDERFGLVHRSAWREHTNSREPGRRLKIGYVSPDFRRHSARHVVEPLLAHHDKAAVEVFAYAELKSEDALTARYRSYADHWIPTRGLSDDALAERIRADGIDILVDLAGHTAHNRLPVFARKPAPVSLSWLGYGYTTGLSAVDYLLTDEAYAPAGCDGLFAETVWRVPTPVYAYRQAEGMGEVSPLPAIERGHVTFGMLTRAIRINHRTIRAWSEILRRIDGARLVVDSRSFQDATMQAALAEKFAAQGIERARLEIGFHSPPWDVMRALDISLDCFPHSSGTTLFESLYMGVPFVSLASRPSVGRLGSSLLQGAGHPEWIAQTEDEYVAKAVELARDLPRLARLRAGLRAEVEASPLMDEAGFARKTEAAYRSMFEKWAGG